MSKGKMADKFIELRKKTGLSQKKFAAVFEIPAGSYAHWEQGLVAPPDYVYNMMVAKLEQEGLIK